MEKIKRNLIELLKDFEENRGLVFMRVSNKFLSDI